MLLGYQYGRVFRYTRVRAIVCELGWDERSRIRKQVPTTPMDY